MIVLTCNIRTSTADDGTNNWKYRNELCGKIIKAQKPDIICFQEMKPDQYNDLRPHFPDFDSYALADEPTGKNPANCIFFRSDSYNLISAAGYWLSETPHVPGSKSWDSNCIRLANWARLKCRDTGAEFRVVNTHLDHISQEARENQSRIIAEDSAAYPDDYPQLLTGDMNCDNTNKAIDTFKDAGWVDTYGKVHGEENPCFTFHGFEGENHDSKCGKMDWIFIRGGFAVSDAAIIKDSREGRFPSDHYFISAEVSLSSKN